MTETPGGRQPAQPQWDSFSENWTRLKGPVRKRWSRLEERHLDNIQGRRESLIDALQDAYALQREEAEAQLEAFESDNQDYARVMKRDRGSQASRPRP